MRLFEHPRDVRFIERKLHQHFGLNGFSQVKPVNVEFANHVISIDVHEYVPHN